MDTGNEMVPVDMTELDEKLAEVGGQKIVGLALPTADNRIYVATLGETGNSHLIVSRFNSTTMNTTDTVSYQLSSGDYSTDKNPAAMNNLISTTDGDFLYTSNTQKVSSIHLSSGVPSVSSIEINSEYNNPLLTLDSSGVRLVAASFGYYSCVGEWWVFDKELPDGTLTLVADQLVLGDCSIAVEGCAGATLAPAPAADQLLFAGPDFDDSLALGIASLAPGTKQAVSLLANLLPEYSPGTSSLATLPSHSLAAFFLATNYPLGPGLAVVQLNPEGTKTAKTQFVGVAELEEGVGVGKDDLSCGLPTGPFVGGIQAFSPNGERLFLGCMALLEGQQELFGVLIILTATN